MKNRGFHDDEEKDLITAYEKGEFRPVEDQHRAKQAAVQAARRYLRKDVRVNIRLYQTLIASVLHKYVSRSTPT